MTSDTVCTRSCGSENGVGRAREEWGEAQASASHRTLFPSIMTLRRRHAPRTGLELLRC